jgi:hypothetical protein
METPAKVEVKSEGHQGILSANGRYDGVGDVDITGFDALRIGESSGNDGNPKIEEYGDDIDNDNNHIHRNQGKRSMDAVSTVEGSPLVVSLKKRQDIQNTPVKFVPLMDTHDEQPHTTAANPLTADVTNTIPTPIPVPEQVFHKILTITTECDAHDTRKDHQESVYRTRILCGPTGCLRRPQLGPILHWEDNSAVKPIPISDLLRLVSCLCLVLQQDEVLNM